MAERVAADPVLVGELREVDASSGVPDGVMEAGVVCMRELHALPVFLESLDGQVPGGLSGQQRRCVADGYRGLDPGVLDAAVADAVGAWRGVEAAGEVRSMLRGCGVKVGG